MNRHRRALAGKNNALKIAGPGYCPNSGAKYTTQVEREKRILQIEREGCHQLQVKGMATALMGDIIRQKTSELKAAVELAAAGHASTSLGILEQKLQAIHTIDVDEARYDAIATRYASFNADERRETLIVTGTNASRNALNEATHQALGLAGRGFEFSMLTRRDTTQAERRVAKYYVAGDVIQPERDYKTGMRVTHDRGMALFGRFGRGEVC